MSTQIQNRRGTTVQHSTFTGANGEITVDTNKKTAVIHDGITAGGSPLAKAGANSDITSLSALSTALSVAQGGTGSTTGNLIATGTTGIGYGTGAGGGVTQATSKSTAVTLNKPTGQITMYGVNDANGQLGAGVTVSFLVNCSLAADKDCVIVNTLAYGSYQVWAESATSSFRIYVKNITASTMAEAVVINFAIIKGATS